MMVKEYIKYCHQLQVCAYGTHWFLLLRLNLVATKFLRDFQCDNDDYIGGVLCLFDLTSVNRQ